MRITGVYRTYLHGEFFSMRHVYSDMSCMSSELLYMMIDNPGPWMTLDTCEGISPVDQLHWELALAHPRFHRHHQSDVVYRHFKQDHDTSPSSQQGAYACSAISCG